MKKLLTTLALCLTVGFTFAQGQLPIKSKAATTNKANTSSKASTTKAGETPQQVAEELCNCFNNYFSQYHPLIKTFIEDMAIQGQEKAAQIFQDNILKLSQEEQTKVIADAQKFAEDANKEPNGLTACFETFQKKTSTMPEAEVKKALEELELSPSCKTIDELMKIGKSGK
ncbi:MAG: hypothetical protein MUC49_04175 [Raineya sp.]|jgi:hypothetical protein|nr:hypothetical protein [Raineya sp.]